MATAVTKNALKRDRKDLLKAIKAYCLGCSNGNVYEVKKCVMSDCELFKYRGAYPGSN
jgi:hypothetical protein